MNAETAAAPLLEIEGLRVDFHLKAGTLTAVDGLSLEIRPGETLGIVGETGSGKSVTALSILGLIPSPPGQIAAGRILFEGADLLRKSRADLRRIRGRQISMIFQEPMTSLNPSIAVGEQIAECYRTHMGHSKRIAAEFTAEILRAVRVPSPREMMRRYPHELSGGMRQRVMIAMALSCEPKLLIADEPTTALDVTIQAQILELLLELQQRFRMALIFISHNLAVVSRLCDRIGVMYAGRLVELAARQALFDRPRHPYTVGLLDAFPRPDARDAELKTIPGSICNLLTPPPGCKFHPRCRKARGVCREQPPPLAAAAGGAVACYFPED